MSIKYCKLISDLNSVGQSILYNDELGYFIAPQTTGDGHDLDNALQIEEERDIEWYKSLSFEDEVEYDFYLKKQVGEEKAEEIISKIGA
jgi:hypothetical protein